MHPRQLAIATALTVLACPTVLAACGGSDPEVSGTPAATTPTTPVEPPVAPTTAKGDAQKLPATIAADDELQTFSTALGATGTLPVLLDRAGPYTVFAPNNDAFSKLGSELDTLLQPSSRAQLTTLLRFHIVAGELKAKDLKNGELLTTLQGTRLRVKTKGGQISVGNSRGSAAVVQPDIDASNGVVHVIDAVLTPKQ